MKQKNTNPPAKIGAALRKARRSQGLGVAAMADAVGLQRDAPWRLEEGRYKLDRIPWVTVERARAAYGEDGIAPLLEALERVAVTR